MLDQIWLWVIFGTVIIVMLGLDLGILNRRPHDPTFREALGWVVTWISLAILFNVFVYFQKGGKSAAEFLAGYLLEQSLSVDNIFVFLLLFRFFKVPATFQHRVLFYGILGAVVMRAFMIIGGVALIQHFNWIMYIFGAILIYTGVKMAFKEDDDVDFEKNIVLRIARKVLPVTPRYEGKNFFVVREGKRFATPLFIVLLMIECTDLVFAVDSIPAIMGVSKDPFILFTSNIFAILGLRSLYFVVQGVMDLFHHLKYGLAFILAFIGVKMIAQEAVGFHVPIGITLGILAVTLTLCIITSLAWPAAEKKPDEEAPATEADEAAANH